LNKKKKNQAGRRKQKRMKSNENFSVSVLKAGTVKLSFFNVDVQGENVDSGKRESFSEEGKG
jgi:hypothetical protein